MTKEIIKQQKNQISFIKIGLEKLATGTKTSYLHTWNEYLQIINKTPQETRPEDILSYRDYLENKGLSQNTIHRKIQGLQRIFELYVKDRKVRYNVIRFMKKERMIETHCTISRDFNVSTLDIDKVLEGRDTKTSLLTETLKDTACRITEILNIKRSDIKEHTSKKGNRYKKIYILGKRKKERYVYISIDLYKRIKEVYRKRSEYLFHSRTGKRLARTNVYTQIRALFKRYAGKDFIGCHKLRHYFGDHYINTLKKSVDAVSDYMGHASPSITLKYYCHGTLAPEEIYE